MVDPDETARYEPVHSGSPLFATVVSKEVCGVERVIFILFSLVFYRTEGDCGTLLWYIQIGNIHIGSIVL